MILAGAAVVSLSAIYACADGSLFDDDMERVAGSGTVVAESRQVGGFEKVTLAGEGIVSITTGDAASLVIETDDNLMQYIETAVGGGELEIRTQEGIDIDPSDGVMYRITAPSINALRLSGAGDIDLDQARANRVTVELLGAGDIEIGFVDATELTMSISGVGRVQTAGEVDSQELSLTGAGSYEGRELLSTTAVVSATGAGSAEVWVTGNLDATISGIGNIDYYGSPQVTESITGIGTLNARGEP